VTILVADERIRAGSIRQMHGRNEYRDWSLDHAVNAIGSAEGCQIPLFGQNGVEPVHALVFRQGSLFALEAKALTLINGHPVTQVTLQSGDRISVGNANLVFTYGGTVPLATVVAPQGQAYVSQQAYNPQPAYVPVQATARMLVDVHGRQVPLVNGQYSVGQHAANSICLRHDPDVAPHHADLVVDQNGITLIDFGTSKGTLRNGQLVQGQVSVYNGDFLVFGTTQFTVIA
jgi:Inner membrane component of T3SS, cytoplasmic domain/FHA domain